jgi:hypothetical protein
LMRLPCWYVMSCKPDCRAAREVAGEEDGNERQLPVCRHLKAAAPNSNCNYNAAYAFDEVHALRTEHIAQTEYALQACDAHRLSWLPCYCSAP